MMCRMPSVGLAFEQVLSSRGIRVDPEAHIKLLLDVPRSHALRTLEGMDRAGSKVIVVTWNSCPEHVADLRDLRPEALLSDEFFLRQDLDAALNDMLDRVSDGECYSFTTAPPTVLTPSERAVLRHVARGWDNKRIGSRLCVCEQTVKNRLRSVYSKLKVCNHAQATLYYWQLWQPPE
jgi:DNA-binding NarL/FixJ family response regulator